MGLINPLNCSDDLKVRREIKEQPGEWSVVVYGGQKCLRVVAYAAGDKEGKRGVKQDLLFTPDKIKTLENILAKWDQAVRNGR